jgi:hypothetical protein
MKVPKIYIGEKRASLTNGANKTGYPLHSTETVFLSFTLHRNQLRVSQNYNLKLETFKLLQENIEKTLEDMGAGNDFLFLNF